MVASRFNSDPVVVGEWPYAMWQRAVARLQAESYIAKQQARNRKHADALARAQSAGGF